MSAADDKHSLPAPPLVGPPPPLRLGGCDLALVEAERVLVEAHGPDGNYLLTLEQTLRVIDLFAEPGRTRILQLLPYHFDIPEDAV